MEFASRFFTMNEIGPSSKVRNVINSHSPFPNRLLELHKCLVCPYQTCDSNTFRSHMCDQHDGFTGYPCCYCDSQFLSLSEFNSHVQHHQDEDSKPEYRPEICRLMPFLPILGKDGRYCCALCDFQTTQSQRMHLHVMIHFAQSRDDLGEGVRQSSQRSDIEDESDVDMHEEVEQGGSRAKKVKRELFCCPLCDYRSTFTHNVLRHGRNVHQEEVKPRSATMKQEAGPVMELSRSHRLPKGPLNDPPAPIECHHAGCQFSSDNAQALHDHQFTRHDGRDLKVFARYPHLPESSSNSYECHVCDFKDVKKNQFQIHLNKHATGCALLNCDQCDFKTIENEQFKVHKIEHDRKNCCYQCSFVAKDKSELEAHKSEHEGQDLVFHCDVCPKVFESEFDLESHLIQIHGFTLRGLYKPNYDGLKDASSPDDGHLSDDEITPDMEVVMFCPLVDPSDVIACGFCSVTLGGTSHYKSHMKMRHPDKVEEVESTYALNIPKDKGYEARPYSCNQCNYSAGNKIDMLYHRYSHEGIKLFACELCQYECHFPSGLRNHRLSKHPGITFDRIRLDAKSIQQYYDEAKMKKGKQGDR